MQDNTTAQSNVRIPDPRIPPELQGTVELTTLDKLLSTVYNWGRKRSLWWMQFGLACCAFEMICTGASRFDIERFGMFFRASPRQADLMFVAGTVTKKMAPQVVRLYNQMPEPKYVVAMGACASGGGPFKEGYNVISGIDQFLPVDVYVPGCPPTPEALIEGYMAVHEKIQNERIDKVRWYRKDPIPAVPVPILGGPDMIDPRHVAEISAAAHETADAGPVGQPEATDVA